MIDLKDLKEKFDLRAVFKLTSPKEYVGELDKGQEVLDRIDLVLTQTFDAIGALPFRQMIVKGKDKKVVIIYYRNNFFGILADRIVDVEKILKYIYEKESKERTEAKAKEKKVKVEPVEEKKEEIVEETASKEVEVQEEKEEEIKEEKAEEAKEVSVSKVVLDSKIIDQIEEIAGNYLGDFSLDIVSNVIEDSGVDRENPARDQVLEVAQSLKDAASLIIGPSKAKKLKEDIMNKIEEG
ncbi:MAG: hypothetical protein P8Y62_04000 [candidate division WOR-3 bacterium]|jgi:hypothetical protein